jgi:hypothetical protein
LGNIGFEELGMIPPNEETRLTQTKIINGLTLKCYGEEGPNSKLWCFVKVPDQSKYLSIHIFTNEDNEVNKTFNQVLSTFKFIDQTTDTTNWKTYVDPKSGYELKYPGELLLNGEQKGSDRLVLYIKSKDMNNYEDEPMGFDLQTATSEKTALENGTYGSTNDQNFPNARKVIRIGNLYGKTDISFQEIEVCNVQFTRRLIFFHNNYQIIISLMAPASYTDKMPEYFTADSVNCGGSPVWKSPEKFYLDIVDKKAPKIALDWYNLFDEIIATIKLTE